MSDILLIDAGNTRIKWAIAPAKRAPSWHAATPVYRARGAVDHSGWTQLAEQWTAHFSVPPCGAWLSNVAGEAAAQAVRMTLQTVWGHALALHQVHAQPSQLGVVNHYTTPSQLGSDRWASLIGARAAYPGEALLIVTLGTATTLESLDGNGHFLGGLIAPGPMLMLDSLAHGTAQLPAAAPENTNGAPFATETRGAITAGCLAAQAGLVERSHAALERHLGQPVRCVITGGARGLLAPHLAVPHTEHDNLVLAGLYEIALAELATSRKAAR